MSKSSLLLKDPVAVPARLYYFLFIYLNRQAKSNSDTVKICNNNESTTIFVGCLFSGSELNLTGDRCDGKSRVRTVNLRNADTEL